jgi:hypothetical protein
VVTAYWRAGSTSLVLWTSGASLVRSAFEIWRELGLPDPLNLTAAALCSCVASSSITVQITREIPISEKSLGAMLLGWFNKFSLSWNWPSSDECFFWGPKRYSELQNKFPETERRRSNSAEIQNAKILEPSEVSASLILSPKENFRANWS